MGTLLCLICTTSIAQKNTTLSLTKQFNQHLKKFPQEKIYLHTDRATYASGDDIWFKAYLVDSKFHLLINTSLVAYVDLIGPQKNIIAQRTIQLSNGLGMGDFKIPYAQNAGNYVLRAYTNYMRNLEPAFFFTKKIKVLDIKESKATAPDTKISARKKQKQHTRKTAVNALDLQFFPEGGYMVDHLVNYVAFKAVDHKGKGVYVQGKIVDGKGKELNAFSSTKMGLGKFAIIPQTNENYTAIVHYKGQNYNLPLPQSKTQGMVLQVKSTPQHLKVVVQSTQAASLKNAKVIAHLRGYVLTEYTHHSHKNGFSFKISKEKIPTGIVHFTLFDAQYTPQCERLAFIENRHELPQVKMTTQNTVYATRSKTSFEISVKDAHGKAIRGNLSLAVVRDDLAKGQNQRLNIQNFLWLSSDLKGYIENPAYYFDTHNQDRHQLMDLLMMTQGWRRFTWKTIQSPPRFSYPYEKGLSIKGRISKFYNHNKAIQGKVKLNFAQNFLINQEVATDQNGKFSFDNLHITDSVHVILQANRPGKLRKKAAQSKQNVKSVKKSIKDRNDAIWIELEDEKALAASIPLNTTSIPDFEKIAEQEIKSLQRTKEFNTINTAYGLEPDVKMLKEVKVTARKIKGKVYKKRPGQLYITPTKRIDFENYNAGTSAALGFFDYMRGKAASIQVTGVNPAQNIRIRGGALSLVGSPYPMYLLNGSPVDVSLIRNLDLNTIAYVDILTLSRSTIYGEAGQGGVVAVYLKEGPPKPVKRDRWGIINFKHPGYYKTREFYIPKYGKNKSLKDTPDYRRILYWNPHINLSKQGKANVQFFTSDEAAKYRIEIEGITLDGKTLLGEYIFEVKNQE